MSRKNNRSNSAFSNFFRNASKADREAMFKDVASKASAAQNKTLEVNKAVVRAADLTQALMDNLDDYQAAQELHNLMEGFEFDDQVAITKGATELLRQRRGAA